MWAFGFILGTIVYFLPIIMAIARHKRNILGIVLVNVLLGWTFIGWVVALVWAFTVRD